MRIFIATKLEDVSRTISDSPTKKCVRDPTPILATGRMRDYAAELEPFLVELFNISTASSNEVPPDLEKAVIAQILKQAQLERG